MENGPLVVSANFRNPLDDRALSKNVFPLSRLCPTASHIHPDFPLLFHLMDTSAFSSTDLHDRLARCRDSALSFGNCLKLRGTDGYQNRALEPQVTINGP